MKPTVILGMAQPYPGYGCEQVTIVASRIPDTIVAFGQTRHNIMKSLFHCSSSAAVHPGRSIQVVVTGMIDRNAQLGTTARIEFLAHPYRGSYPTVNRAANLHIGASHVCTNVSFIL
jgi:hypothetical protein